MGVGIFMIVGGIIVIANSFGNTGIGMVGVILIIAGVVTYSKNNKTTRGSKDGSNGHSGGDGYDGPIHTGSGTPTSVHTSYGRDIDMYGTGWREVYGGRENIITGEKVEKNIYNNWEYTDSDGDVDSNATFGYD